MTPTLAEQITALVDAEVKRITTEKDAQIADLTSKLKDSEARWERLRSLLGASPSITATLPPVASSDTVVADFHARRRVGFVSIRELAEALNVNYSNAQTKYSQWCVKHGVARINYTSNGQQVMR